MNDALAGRSSADQAFSERVGAVRAGGVTRVQSCDDARTFIRLQREYDESQPSMDSDPEHSGEDVPRGEEAFSAGSPDHGIDKVAEGGTYYAKSTVLVWIPNGTGEQFTVCTGSLIGPQALLLARHCFSSSAAFQRIEVDYGVNPGWGCIVQNCGVTKSQVFFYPGYLGTGDVGNDLALVISYPWTAPANTADFWIRIIDEFMPTGTSYWTEGFGVDMNHPTHGFGVSRRSNHSDGISWQSGFWWKSYVTAGYGRGCDGDSGGPAVNQTLTPSGSRLMIGTYGIFWSFNDWCPAVGDGMGYTRLSDKTAWINDVLPNGCYHGNTGGIDYIRCWYNN